MLSITDKDTAVMIWRCPCCMHLVSLCSACLSLEIFVENHRDVGIAAGAFGVADLACVLQLLKPHGDAVLYQQGVAAAGEWLPGEEVAVDVGK